VGGCITFILSNP